ncbi:MAG: hypothetical protein GY780_17725 [bacterium]|nr:hypothetical protein [bacterium]
MTATLLQKTTLQEMGQQEQSPAMRKLLRGYLHKTSNSLCGIKGYAGLIVELCENDSTSIKYAQKIINEIDRMEGILTSVGDMKMSRKPFESGYNVQGVVDRAIADLTLLFPEAQCKTNPIPDGQLLLPEADLKLVLKELLTNSYQACGSTQINLHGQVGLTGRIEISITDHGAGMNSHLLKMASDPFVTTRENHHGVGLTRVETILDMHELAWSMTSRQGQGTSVVLEVAEALNWNPKIV